ncbi:hypothetical protein KVR01_007088 [Diaporthe batatas]|uniref:uncharacterized protein n=1 Tax=Diaporthe batatas TaxID=748121 RepID=UPI001D049C35|nr:uncharacterized protein KVR01_007088 [Diaporthe batatas]KAG8163791.1 hypothetical protein KVR01_007088 [Diaporthe batatas]
MVFPFEVIEHTIPAQHIREWPRATAVSQERTLQLCIKQYKPIDNPEPQPGDVTEVYEALWTELHARAQKHGFRIRAIWIADAAHQGHSGVLNEGSIGNDPSWYDHARDLLYMTNAFRDDMPQPIVGIGHSFGGSVLTHLSLMHARLFTALVLFDPIIMMMSLNQTGAILGARMSAVRRETWPTREAAAESFRRSPFHKSWDTRVLDAYIAHGIRDLPASTASGEAGKAALTTPRDQEVFTFFRPLYPYVGDDGAVDRDGAPDFDPTMNDKPHKGQPFPFYRSEGSSVLARLPHVRPSVLWVYGEKSDVNLPPSARSENVKACGTGPDGSGGVQAGKVAEVVIEGRGHLFPLEVPDLCAEHAAAWVGKEIQRYRKAQLEYEDWTHLPLRDKVTISPEFAKALGRPSLKKPRNKSSTRSKL